MNEQKWVSWTLQTSKTWEDIEDVLYLTKIDFIDYDHKILVEYALKLNKMINQLDNNFSLELLEGIGVLLIHLYEYAVEHFTREEQFMEKYELPDIDVHKMEHEKILLMLKNAIDDYKKGKVTVSHELKVQVMDWLIQHINVADIDFFQIDHWSKSLVNAEDWDSVKDIISLTGVEEIDKQHKQLTEMAIDLFTKLVGVKSLSEIESSFVGFKAIVKEHFEYENEFMTRYDMEDIDKHNIEHQYFIKRLDKFPKEIHENPNGIEDLKVWILTWWINHINITDHDAFISSNWLSHVIDKAETFEETIELLRCTQISTIDDDHLEVMKLTFLLNNMIKRNTDNKSLTDPATKEEIINLLKKIYVIAEKHFQREETIMRRYEMVDYASHFSEHANILIKIKTMLNNYVEDRLYASNHIKTIILDWWINHTNNVDYRTFVINVDEETAERIRKEESKYASS